MALPVASLASVGLLLLALVSSAAAAAAPPQCSVVIAGASSFANIGAALTAACSKAVKNCAGASYISTNSQDGINGFNAGTYCLGQSNYPMTVLDDLSGISKSPGKFTLPATISTFGFWVGSKAPDGTVKMTAQDTYNIFLGPAAKAPAVRVWSKYLGAEAAGVLGLPMKVYGRGNGTGQNYINRVFWKVALGLTQLKPLDDSLYPNMDSYFPSVSSICNAVNNVRAALGYAQVGVCGRAIYTTISEVGIKNKAGTYLAGSSPQAQAIQAVPRTYPAASKTWSAIAESLVFQKGEYTPALNGFEYEYIRQKDLTVSAKGVVALALATYVSVNAGGLANQFGMTPIPSKLQAQNLAALKKVT